MPRNLDDYDVWLLISGDSLYPFSSHGFHVAQGTLAAIAARTRDNLFLKADGHVFRIGSIAPRQATIATRAKRLLGMGYEIEVTLDPHPLELPDLKDRVITGLENYRAEVGDDESWHFASLPLAQSRDAIASAETPMQLFATLDLPRASDCLDLL